MKDCTKEYQELLKDFDLVGATILKCNKTEITEGAFLGVEDQVSKNPTSLHSIYRIASVSKVVIALGIMKLVEMKLVDVHEDISKYLGYKVENPHFKNIPITLEQLMTQTSSIHDGEDEKLGYDGVNGPKMEVSLKELLTNPEYVYYTDKTWSDNFPGTDFCYSNFGCGICACIIESVTHKFYSDFIREEILLPLGLDASYRVSDIIHKENICTLYDYDEKTKTFVVDRSPSLFYEKEFPIYSLGNNFRGPAGGLFISGEDLAKLNLMLINKGYFDNKRLFKEKTLEEMKEIHWMGDAKGEPMYHKKGLQLMILDGYAKSRMWGHFGCAYGLRSFFFFSDSFGLIFLCNGANYGDGTDHITPLQERLMAKLLEEEK
jgi:D-alanyl-D-alanine carboxypeptidase